MLVAEKVAFNKEKWRIIGVLEHTKASRWHTKLQLGFYMMKIRQRVIDFTFFIRKNFARDR